jgi:ribosomal protein L36
VVGPSADNCAVVAVVNTNGRLTVICPTALKFKSLPDSIVAAPTEVTVNVDTYNVCTV